MCQAIIPRRTPPDGQRGNQLQISHIASKHPKNAPTFWEQKYTQNAIRNSGVQGRDFRPCTLAPKRFYSAPENTGLNKRPVFAFDNKITNFAN